MKLLWIKFLLWLIEKSYVKPNNQLANMILKTAGKFNEHPHRTVYYKDGWPL